MDDLDFAQMEDLDYASLFPRDISDLTSALDRYIEHRLYVQSWQGRSVAPSANEMGRFKRKNLEATLKLKKELDKYIERHYASLSNPMPSANTELMYSTVRLDAELPSGFVSHGTAFFYSAHPNAPKSQIFLVTNKHVVEDSLSIRARIHRANKDRGAGVADMTAPVAERFQWIDLPPCQKWVAHPDANVDLCGISFEPYLDDAHNKKEGLFLSTLTSEHVLSDWDLWKLNAVEDILMVGYPNGIWDEVNNLPLMRKGVTASHPAVDYGGRAVTVVDMACYPGSSGSPVVLAKGFRREDYWDGATRKGVVLGVLVRGPLFTADGKIVIRDIPTVSKPVVETQVMMHLGHIIKAKELVALGNHLKEHTPSVSHGTQNVPVVA